MEYKIKPEQAVYVIDLQKQAAAARQRAEVALRAVLSGVVPSEQFMVQEVRADGTVIGVDPSEGGDGDA